MVGNYMSQDGTNIIIYDFDRPRDIGGQAQCIEISIDLLKEKLMIINFRLVADIFGATILNICPNLYIGI